MSQRQRPLQAALWVLACAAFGTNAAAQPAAPSAPQAPRTQAPASSEDEDTVVVTGQRQYGAVVGDAVPQIVLSPEEIRSYGASNLSELMDSLAPETGSARGRGGGGPVILLNGRRIAGFGEIATIPPEAIQRVEIFTEDVALQYGYSADQRVVNIVLRRFFRTVTSEGNTGEASHGNAEKDSLEIGDLSITPRGRVNVDGKLNSANAFTQLEGHITPPVGVDDRNARTLGSDSDGINATGVWNHVINRVWAVTSSLTAQSNTSESLLGLDPITHNVIHSDTDSTSAHLGFTLDGSTQNWMWTMTATAQRDTSNTNVDTTQRSRSDSTNTTYDLTANTNGKLFTLPAGPVRLAARVSYNDSTLDGTSLRNAITTNTSLDRSDWGARVTLNAPLTNANRHVFGAFGNVSAHVTAAFDELSDFDMTHTLGAGLSWAPISDIHISFEGNHAQSAPSLQQLGAPTLTTPGVQVFDPVTQQNVMVTVTTGGNPALKAEKDQDFTLNASWSPHTINGLTVSASYVHNETDNDLMNFPQLTPAIEAAFPGRVTRDGGGNLIAIDRRPINIARRDSETARVGVTFSQGFGPRLAPQGGFGGFRARFGGGNGGPPPDGGPPPGAPPAGGPSPSDAAAGGPPPGDGAAPPGGGGDGGGRGFGGDGGGRGFGGGGFGGGGFGGGGGGFGGGGRGGGGGFRGGGGQAGRWNVSVFYSRRLENSIVFAPGQQSLDLLSGAALGADGGGGADKVEFEGGVSWKGAGLRLNGTWNSGYRVLGTVAAQDLTYSDNTNVGLRAFLDFDSHPEWQRAHPILRHMRIIARVDNLFDTVPKITDATGAIPFSDQRNFLSPQGRAWQIGLRKLF